MNRIRAGLSLFLLLFVSLLAAHAAAPAPTNLLENGTLTKATPRADLTGELASAYQAFEKAGGVIQGETVPDGWIYRGHAGTPVMGFDAKVKHGDSPSLKMTNQSLESIAVLFSATPITLKPKTRYAFSYYVKGENIINTPKGTGAISYTNYRVKAETPGQPTPKWQTLWLPPALAGTFDWQRMESVFLTGDQEEIWHFGLQLRFASGSVWFSDICVQETPNLLANGGFEGWGPQTDSAGRYQPTLTAGSSLGWVCRQGRFEEGDLPIKGSVSRDAAVKHGGAFSARIENGLTTDFTEIALPVLLPARPSAKYRLRCWIKGENITLNPKDGAGVTVYVNSGPPAPKYSTNVKYTSKRPENPSGSFDWTPFEFIVETNADAGQIVVSLQLRRASGTLWFDDVELTEVAAE
ncbi:MAG: hypothetical protein ACYC7E_06500 [Armatimonadota bacterium]